MEKVLKIVFIVLAVLVLVGALFLGGAFVGAQWFGRASFANSAAGPAFQNGSGGQSGGQGGAQNPSGPASNFWGGMMGGAQGRFGGFRGPMMGQGNNRAQANVTPITADEAKSAAQSFVDALKIDGLQVGDVTLIGNGAHVTVLETASGNGAFELVVDPFTKTAYAQPGAPTLWNLKYGGVLQANLPFGRGPMMGRLNNSTAVTPTPAANSAAAVTPADVSADMPITSDEAIKAAQTYLAQAVPTATLSASAQKFYGYYSVSYSLNGSVAGVLSINGYNAEVLPEGQHGMMFAAPN